MEAINFAFIKSLWSIKDVGWDFVQSVGSSRGILSMWDSSLFVILELLDLQESKEAVYGALDAWVAG